MAKRWKYIRAAFIEAGFTSREQLNGFIIDSITEVDGNGYYVYYTDASGDKWRAKFGDTNSPIIVNSNTIAIRITPTPIYIAGVSGYTSTLEVVNQDLVNVLFECRTTSDVYTTTGGTYGQIISAARPGTSTVNVYHNDGVSGTTSIEVGQINLSLLPSGGTLDPTGTGSISVTGGTSYYLPTGLTIKNSNEELVNSSTAVLRYIYDGIEYPITTPYTPSNGGIDNEIIIYDVNAKAFNSNTGVSYVVSEWSRGKDFLTFTLPGQSGDTVFGSQTVSILMPSGTTSDTTSGLTASFTVSEGVIEVKIGMSVQESGVTINNFNSPVSYIIMDEFGSEITWSVTVTVAS